VAGDAHPAAHVKEQPAGGADARVHEDALAGVARVPRRPAVRGQPPQVPARGEAVREVGAPAAIAEHGVQVRDLRGGPHYNPYR
jgi:hypothetical protein